MNIQDVAEKLIWPITGSDTRDATALGSGRYTVSEVGGQSDQAQIITAHGILAGAITWAGNTLVSLPSQTDPADRTLATAIVTGDWAVAGEQLARPESMAGVEIWDLMTEIAAETA